MKKQFTFSTLDPEKIVGTLEKLQSRIDERFPNSGLAAVGSELTAIARATSARAAVIAKPNVALRALVVVVLGASVGLIVWLAIAAVSMPASGELTEVAQGLDAGVSLLIVLGGAALYLSTLEGRFRRDRALKALHEFRSIVHVIDMHQLTKDPSAFGVPQTSYSPERLGPHALVRYLGFCSELLSLASKVAALYADKVRDPVVIDAVGDIERLTTDLAAKIWQKITLMQGRIPGRPPSDALAPHAEA